MIQDIYKKNILPVIQLVACWAFKKHLINLMKRNGFIVDNTITPRQLRRFYCNHYPAI